MGPIDETEAAFKGSTSLEEFRISHFKELTCLPEGVLQPTLLKIFVGGCPKLKTLNPIDESEVAFNNLTSLQQLVILDCPELITLPEAAFKGSTSLEEFRISHFKELTSLPEGVLQPTLQKIFIGGCPKLKTLNPIDKSEVAFNNLTSLQQLVILDCPELISIPEAAFKGSTSLEEFRISHFKELTSLPEGVLQPTLQKIFIGGCPKLKTLNPIDESEVAFNNLTSLQQLVILDCPELITLPAWVLQPTLVDIDIQRCPKLKMLDPIDKIAAAFNGLTSLRKLCICDCPELTRQEAAFKGSTSLEEFRICHFKELTCLPEGVLQPTLQKIFIGGCPKLKTLNPIDESEAAFNNLTSLQQLVILDCPELITLPEAAFKGLTSLEEFRISHFKELTCLPERVLQPTLQKLFIGGCPKLKTLNPIDESEATFNNLTSLQQLVILDCPELITLPEAAFKGLTSLEEFRISHFKELTSLPEGVLQPTLQKIFIGGCPKLKTLNPIDESEAAFNNLTSLQQLVILDCPELITLPEAAFNGLTSLEEFRISHFKELTCLPKGVLQPTLLKIFIGGCPKLKTLNPIDESEAAFNNLTSLQQLVILDCPELITLPAWVLQPTLIDVDIQRCPKLKMLDPIDKIAAACNGFTSLRKLCICDWPELTRPEATFKGLISLEEFRICHFKELTCLPEGVLQPTLLKIFIGGCPKLKTLNPIDESEAAFNNLTSLQQLVILDCPELITLPEAAFKGSTSLEEFRISHFKELTCLPEGVLQPTLLKIFLGGCPKLKTLNPIDESEAAFNNLTSLQQLVILDCPELITLPAWVLQPTLIDIDIQRCPKLKMLNPIDKIAAAFNGLTSLRKLCICDCPELTRPEATFKGLTSLEEFRICHFKELTCLPKGVLQPTLLKIFIGGCPKLKTLNPIDESEAAFNNLTSLQQLVIHDCPELITLPDKKIRKRVKAINKKKREEKRK
ncbi:hypothetical protein RHMOL_Rhmol09G0019400 [Rhododendron molle]|uniref:Uncharacterized protein n=1 Tax=Rhododendron molle TaxID=49168 RepID=A0ACC0M9W8_RHOML|nr:hypothetical protein RHMOL_Rhmol09G0019400 [Rhododendron molle]